jgi:hypothetical protein
MALLTRSPEWSNWSAESLPLDVVDLREWVSQDPALWTTVALDDVGAVLVRPDQHVMWRSTEGPAAAGAELQRCVPSASDALRGR